MSTLQLAVAEIFDTQMVMQTGTCTSDVILSREIQKHPSYAAGRHETIDQGKYEKVQVNKSGQKGNIMFRRMLMLRTKMLR